MRAWASWCVVQAGYTFSFRRASSSTTLPSILSRGRHVGRDGNSSAASAASKKHSVDLVFGQNSSRDRIQPLSMRSVGSRLPLSVRRRLYESVGCLLFLFRLSLTLITIVRLPCDFFCRMSVAICGILAAKISTEETSLLGIKLDVYFIDPRSLFCIRMRVV